MYRIEPVERKQISPREAESSHLLSLSDDLYISQRDLKVLIVEPDTASSLILPRSQYYFFQQLKKPQYLADFIARNSWTEASQLLNFINIFYTSGVMEVDGKSANLSTELWKQEKRLPNVFAIQIRQPGSEGRAMPQELSRKIVGRICKEITGDVGMFVIQGTDADKDSESISSLVMTISELTLDVKKAFRIFLKTEPFQDEKLADFCKNNRVEFGFYSDELSSSSNDSADVFRRLNKFVTREIQPLVMAPVYDAGHFKNIFERLMSEKLYNQRFILLNLENTDGREIAVRDLEKFVNVYMEIVDLAIEFNKNSKEKVQVMDLSSMLEICLAKERRNFCFRSPCGAGNTLLAFDVDGNIYPCDLMFGVDKFKLGNIADSTVLSDLIEKSPVVRELNEHVVEAIPRCSKCQWRNFCGSSCAAVTFRHYNTIYREHPLCKFYMVMWEKILWKIYEEAGILTLQNLVPMPESGGARGQERMQPGMQQPGMQQPGMQQQQLSRPGAQGDDLAARGTEWPPRL